MVALNNMSLSARLTLTAVLAAAASSLCSAAEHSAPRKLLSDSNSTTSATRPAVGPRVLDLHLTAP